MKYFNTILAGKYLSQINFYLIVFFVLRLYHISNPPLEVAHNWRQTTVTMVARNFYEVNNNILYPRVDFAGTKTGITGMEFPFLNYFIYLISCAFGYAHWYGRLINLIVSTFGILYFNKIIKKYFSSDIAFYSSIVLLFSLWFPYSRKIMPDTFSFSLVMMSVFYGIEYFNSNKIKNLLLYFIFGLIGVLSKLPSGYILIVFSLFVFNPDVYKKTKVVFVFTTFLMLIPIFYWYFYWVPYLNKTYKFSHFYMGDSISNGIRELKNNLFATFSKFFDNAIKYIGFFIFLFGLWMGFYKKNRNLLLIFFVSTFGFVIVILKAGFAFHHHSYYIIPFVPVMAFVCGYGISAIKSQKLKIIFVIAISLEGFLNNMDDFFIRDKDYQLINLESDLDKLGKKTDLILINSETKPTPMYFTHRKGLITYNDSLIKNDFISCYKNKGYKFVVVLKQTFGSEIKLNLEQKISNPYYDIYKL